MGNITTQDLAIGDVLLYNGNGFVSDAICFFDGTPYSHASLFLGNDRIGEALAEGLRKRTVKESFEHANYVLARRLISGPPDMTPVVAVADRYLKQVNRYGFEQLLLLAFLTLTRRLKENKYLNWLVRKVLDKAAAYLMDHSDRQPMICSEFVYLCYEEAIPDQADPFTLWINTFPVVGAVAPGARILGAPAAKYPGSGLHQDSLLVWAIRSRGLATATGVPRSVIKRTRAGKHGKEDAGVARISLEEIIGVYLTEARKPATSRAAVASPRTPEVLTSIDRFAEAFRSASAKRRSGAKMPSRPGLGRLPAMGAWIQDPLQYLRNTVADFVTPGDLLKCGSLHDVGTIQP